MTNFQDGDLSGSTFQQTRLAGSRFERVDLSESRFHAVDFSRGDLRDVAFYRARLRGAFLIDTDISGEVRNLTINGVDVGPLIEAELNRRDPERAAMFPSDPDGFRAAWDILERRWAQTERRAAEFPPEQLHESVDGEWSFIETLRHLVFATDCWILRAILGDPAPWHPLALPCEEMPDTPGVPRDRNVRPSLDEALELRRDRMGTVRSMLDELTEESLAAHTEPVEGPGWPEPISYPVQECLQCILVEEWEHRRFAERDLDLLAART